MPTKPIEELIPRKIENEALSSILYEWSELIDETVNFSSHVLKWCLYGTKQGDECIPIIMTFRHILELIDSISILIKNSCIEPCKILLRSGFESLLTIEYIFEKDTRQRGMDFLVWNRHRSINICRRHNPNDTSYKNLQAIFRKDKLLKNTKLLEIPKAEDEINNLKKIFEKPGYSDSNKEYLRMKKKCKNNPRWWFSLHNGPTNLKVLADYLSRPAEYEVLYRHWSALAHGTDIMARRMSIEEGKLAVHQLRMPNDAQVVTQMTISFALTSIRLFINYFVKEKEKNFAEWYKNEIRGKYLSLIGNDIIKVK